MNYEAIEAQAVSLLDCSHCKRRPGHWCRTASGALARRPHGARTQPLYAVWGDGFLEGELEGVKYAHRHADNPDRVQRWITHLEKKVNG